MQNNNVFLLLTGDVGTGKTTLVNAFAHTVGENIIIAKVSDPGLDRLGFFRYIAEMFALKDAFVSESEFLSHFSKFLQQTHSEGKKVLLIIDEAQQLTDETLEEIRLLSKLEVQENKLLNIFLVGQNEVQETLERPKNRAILQKITSSYTLRPLELEETKACIKHRLAVAGATEAIFTEEALDLIHKISSGFPRLINIICDNVLTFGCKLKEKPISAKLTAKCIEDIHLSHLLHSFTYRPELESVTNWIGELDGSHHHRPDTPHKTEPFSQCEPPMKAQLARSEHFAVVSILFVGFLVSGYYLTVENGITLPFFQ